MPERKHIDDDWRELGEHLYRAQRGLMDAYFKASEMWGNAEDVPLRILEIHGALNALRLGLDNEYYAEDKERHVGFPDPIFGADRRIHRDAPLE